MAIRRLFEELAHIGKQDLREQFLSEIASHSKYPSIRAMGKKITLMQELKDSVSKDDILLGAVDKTYEDPVILEGWDRKSAGFLICGKKGSGKTTLAKALVLDNLYYKFNQNVFMVDPKGDYPNIDKPQQVPEIISALEKFKMKPQGYHAKYCVPKFLDLFGARGTHYTLSMRDFKTLDAAVSYTHLTLPTN